MQRDEESGGSSQVQVYNHSRYWSFRLEILERFLMIRWLSLIVFLPTVVLAQSNPSAKIARQWRQQHEQAIVDEFVTLLSVPNIPQDRENIQRNAELIARMMGKRGIAARLVSVPGGSPVVFGEIRTPGATPRRHFLTRRSVRKRRVYSGGQRQALGAVACRQRGGRGDARPG
jgi:hypothetical protein